MGIFSWRTAAGAGQRAAQLVRDQRRRDQRAVFAGLKGLTIDTLDALFALLAHAEPADAAAAAEVLGLSARPEALQPLLEALQSPHREVVVAATQALPRVSADGDVLRPLARHPNPVVRATVLGFLAALPGDWVEAALADPDAGVRVAALRILEDAPSDGRRPSVLLADPSEAVRVAACHAVREACRVRGARLDPDQAKALMFLLEGTPDEREAAAEVLGYAHEASAFEALVTATTRGSLCALRALARLGDIRALPALRAALLRPGSVGVAAEALATMGDVYAIPLIEAAMAALPPNEGRPDTPSDRGAALLALESLRKKLPS